MNNITYSGDWDLCDLKWLNLSETEMPKYTVRKGDLLFNRTNSPELVGKTAVWPLEEVYGFAGYLIRMRFDEARAVAGFVSAYLNSSYGKALLFKSAIPSNNMSNISATTFRRLPLILPPLDLQKRFVEYSTQVSLAVTRQQRAAGESDSLFQALVQRAFRGDL
jgi:type I restriction enzyme, S subunit